MELILSAGVRDPDAEAVERVRAGEHEAFEALVGRYQRPIYALAYRYVPNTAEAADLTQEIFVRVWEKLDSFRGESKFSTWLFQLAGNHCKNRLKYLSRRRYYQHDSMDTQPDEDEGPTRQFADTARGADEEYDARRMQVLVRRLMAELTEEYRLVLFMRDVDDMDYEDISSATGLPLGTVKSRIFRGRAELAKRLKKALGEDPFANALS